jgi:hypothetical protein
LEPLLGQAASRLLPGSLPRRVFVVYGITLVLFFGVALGLFFAHEYRQQVDTTQTNSVMLIEVVNQAVQNSVVIGDYDSVRKTLDQPVPGSVSPSASFTEMQSRRCRSGSIGRRRRSKAGCASVSVSASGAVRPIATVL